MCLKSGTLLSSLHRFYCRALHLNVFRVFLLFSIPSNISTWYFIWLQWMGQSKVVDDEVKKNEEGGKNEKRVNWKAHTHLFKGSSWLEKTIRCLIAANVWRHKNWTPPIYTAFMFVVYCFIHFVSFACLWVFISQNFEFIVRSYIWKVIRFPLKWSDREKKHIYWLCMDVCVMW